MPRQCTDHLGDRSHVGSLCFPTGLLGLLLSHVMCIGLMELIVIMTGIQKTSTTREKYTIYPHFLRILSLLLFLNKFSQTNTA